MMSDASLSVKSAWVRTLSSSWPPLSESWTRNTRWPSSKTCGQMQNGDKEVLTTAGIKRYGLWCSSHPSGVWFQCQVCLCVSVCVCVCVCACVCACVCVCVNHTSFSEMIFGWCPYLSRISISSDRSFFTLSTIWQRQKAVQQSTKFHNLSKSTYFYRLFFLQVVDHWTDWRFIFPDHMHSWGSDRSCQSQCEEVILLGDSSKPNRNYFIPPVIC